MEPVNASRTGVMVLSAVLSKSQVDEIFDWTSKGIPGKAGSCRIRIYCDRAEIQQAESSTNNIPASSQSL
jgi:hypothetical protein